MKILKKQYTLSDQDMANLKQRYANVKPVHLLIAYRMFRTPEQRIYLWKNLFHITVKEELADWPSFIVIHREIDSYALEIQYMIPALWNKIKGDLERNFPWVNTAFEEDAGGASNLRIVGLQTPASYEKYFMLMIVGLLKFGYRTYQEAVYVNCKVCGAIDATFTCGQCNIPTYCSKQCQKNDWEIYKHANECL
jgi:hypothetical protein